MVLDRELWKNGRKIICYIETREDEYGTGFYLIYGRPSQSHVISWRFSTYSKAEDKAYKYFCQQTSGNINQTLSIV